MLHGHLLCFYLKSFFFNFDILGFHFFLSYSLVLHSHFVLYPSPLLSIAFRWVVPLFFGLKVKVLNHGWLSLVHYHHHIVSLLFLGKRLFTIPKGMAERSKAGFARFFLINSFGWGLQVIAWKKMAMLWLVGWLSILSSHHLVCFLITVCTRLWSKKFIGILI